MNKGKKPQRYKSSENSGRNQKMVYSSQDLSSSSQQQAEKNAAFDRVISRFEDKFGPTGTRWLSVIGSLCGVARGKIKNIEILCDGKELQGYYSIEDLMLSGHLANKGLKSNKNNRNLFYLSHITAALPHSPFLFLETLDEDDETVARVIGHNIQTSLPRSLRYFRAADMPLGPKTRKAHVLWCINFAEMIKSRFDPRIYEQCAQNAFKFRQIPQVITILNDIESNILLSDDEALVSYPF